MDVLNFASSVSAFSNACSIVEPFHWGAFFGGFMTTFLLMLLPLSIGLGMAHNERRDGKKYD